MKRANIITHTIGILGYCSVVFGSLLTAQLGTVQYNGHKETWYNLDMSRCVKRAQDMGIPCEYWEREDGCKMFGPWVIVAADPSVTRYTFIETSRGTGIVLDRHTAGDPKLYDLAVTW